MYIYMYKYIDIDINIYVYKCIPIHLYRVNPKGRKGSPTDEDLRFTSAHDNTPRSSAAGHNPKC